MFEYSSAALYYYFNDRLIWHCSAFVRRRVYVNVPVDVGILDNNIIYYVPGDNDVLNKT